MTTLNLKELDQLPQEELLQIAAQVQDLKRARRAKKLDFYLQNAHPGQIAFHKATERIRYIFAGNRCLVGDTKVDTPTIPRPISELENGDIVRTLNLDSGYGWARCTKAINKGHEKVFKVTHEAGSFTGSAKHAVLLGNGDYEHIENLEPGIVLRMGKVTSKVESVTSAGFADVFTITVQGTHNYVLADGTVHENSGKSTAGMAELIWCCMGTHPFQKVKIPIKSCVILIDFENAAKSVFEPKLTEWAPEGSIKKIDRHQGGAIKRIHWVTGSITDVYSHDQAISVFEGSDYDLAWFDEPPPKNIWNAVWRGMTDRGGRMYLSGTPLTSPWLYDEWRSITESRDPLKWAIQFNSKENAKNLGEGDVELGLKRLEEFASLLSKEEKAARLEGGFMQLQGLIFKDWNRGIHLIRPFPIPVQWQIIESIDPHPAKPWAVTWTAKAPNGSKILLQSLYLDGTLDEIATSIVMGRERLKIRDDMRPRIVKTLIDNASSVPLWQKSNTDPTARRLSVREEMENMIGPRGAGGPRIVCAPKNVAGKIDLFKRWLTVKERNGQQRADFYVFDTEENDDFVSEIETYRWAKFKAKDRQDEARGQPVKKDDDLIDSVLQVALTEGEEPESAPDTVDMTNGFGGYGARTGSGRSTAT